MNGAAAGWQTLDDPKTKKPYYYNPKTNVTTYIVPDDLLTPAQLATGWAKTTAEGGRPYYFRKDDKNTTSWSPPEGWDAAPPPAHDGFVSSSFQLQTVRPDHQRDSRDSRPARPERQWNDRRDDGGGFRGPMAVIASGPEYGSQADAEAAFTKLLRKAGVQPGWSWERAMRATIQDPQYRAIKEPNDRKAAFEKYLEDVVKEDEEKEKERIRKLRTDFRTMLASHVEIKHYTRWKTARPVLEGETIFRSTDNETEKKRLFDEYIVHLKKAEEDQRKQDYDAAVNGLGALLKGLNLTAKSQWTETREQLLSHPEYSSEPKYRRLPPSEPLQQFDRYMRKLWDDAHREKQHNAQLKARRQRKARDAFVDLLSQLRAAEKITPSTTWKEIYPSLEHEPAYINLLENLGHKNRVSDGSTPQDLFFDVIEEFDRELYDMRVHVEGLLKDQHFRLTPATTLDQFLEAVRTDRRGEALSKPLLEELYKRIRKSATDREEDLERDAKRQQRKAVDALRSRIKHLEPPVAVGDTWEEVRPRVERYEEFRQVSSDEDRQVAFDKHMNRLKEDAAERERERARRHDRERDRTRDDRHGSRRDTRRRSRTPTRDSGDPYEADRRRAASERERQYRPGSVAGLSPPPRDGRRAGGRGDDRYERDDTRDRRERQVSLSVYDRERREREAERERSYISRADPRSKASELDYGDSSDAASRPEESVSGKRASGEQQDSRRQAKVLFYFHFQFFILFYIVFVGGISANE